MRHLTLTVLLSLALIMCACKRGPGPGDGGIHVTPAADPAARTKAVQSRLAGAFYDAILPGLRTCWNRLQGEGEVEFTYTYVRNGRRWVWQKQEIAGSSLPESQRAAARDCMEKAARGSAFPVDEGEAARNTPELVITWGWPVPLPPDTSQLARMVDTGGGGGECRKACKDCAYSKETGKSFCAPACSGWTDCREDGTGTGCQMTRPECATGWSGRWVGTFIASVAEPVSSRP